MVGLDCGCKPQDGWESGAGLMDEGATERRSGFNSGNGVFEEDRCIGCAKCVQPCEMFGNASFYLQVRHDICVNCNNC